MLVQDRGNKPDIASPVFGLAAWIDCKHSPHVAALFPFCQFALEHQVVDCSCTVYNENIVELVTQVFDTLLEAKVLTERWRTDYNDVRPHSALDYYPPVPQVRVPWPVNVRIAAKNMAFALTSHVVPFMGAGHLHAIICGKGTSVEY